MRSTYTPERIERTRQEMPPTLASWYERQGFSCAAARFESCLDDLRRDTCDELEQYAPKGVDARTILHKFQQRREGIFCEFWEQLPENER